MIQKKDLVDGWYYWGNSRNTYVAVWDSNKQLFVYLRFKFGSWIEETIPCCEDDAAFRNGDCFNPQRCINVEMTTTET